MIMRNLRPMVIHIDAQSFGGDMGGGEVVARLKQRGIPVLVLAKDMDIKEALENPAL
jgi:hypothetical protein